MKLRALVRRPALRWSLLGAAALGAAASAVELGWLEGPRPWTEATGWNRLPLELRREPTPAPLWEGTAGEAPTLSWLGHSGFVLHWRGATLLLDPNLSPWVSVTRRRQPAPLEPAELGPVDAVLISHAHLDHLDLPTLEALAGIGSMLVPNGSSRYLSESFSERAAAVHVEELGSWASRRIGELEVTAVPAAHNGNRSHPLRSRVLAVGWVIRAGDDAIYFAGDTGPGNDFDAIRERFHPRVAILPIGAFAPAWPIGLYHTSPEQAVEVGRRLAAELVVPCHFGTFRLSLDRHGAALPRFARAAAERGLLWRMPALATPPEPGPEPAT